MGAVIWFCEHDLVLVRKIEGPAEVFHDADVEHCRSNLKRAAIG